MKTLEIIEKAKTAPRSRTQLVPADLRIAKKALIQLGIKLCDTHAYEHIQAAIDALDIEAQAMIKQPDSDYNTRKR